ncbi:MAG: hypothetical protein IPK20_13775 [Betaproteobacteria bacterium]|nr:hypothetical protein [Betaproteobacteria bacterium]
MIGVPLFTTSTMAPRDRREIGWKSFWTSTFIFGNTQGLMPWVAMSPERRV